MFPSQYFEIFHDGILRYISGRLNFSQIKLSSALVFAFGTYQNLKIKIQVWSLLNLSFKFWFISKSITNSVNIYFFKVNNRNTRRRCEICSKSTTETPERLRRRSGVFIVNFVSISHFFLVFLLLTWTIKCYLGR